MGKLKSLLKILLVFSLLILGYKIIDIYCYELVELGFIVQHKFNDRLISLLVVSLGLILPMLALGLSMSVLEKFKNKN